MRRTERLILIVDDSPEDRESVRRYLRKDQNVDYRFIEDSTGVDGLATCQSSGVDCLLLDDDLPDLDGLQFLAELTGGTDHAPVPVIMLTGRGGKSVAVEALKRGAQDYLVKGTYSPETLRRTVDDAIERVAIRRELDRQREELGRLYHEARKADRRKDEFLAMLAHELRNPLAPILNAVHLLKVGNSDPAVHRRIGAMLDQQARHLCRLVDDLLDVSRITRGKIQLQTTTVDLSAIVNVALDNARPTLDQRRQRLAVKLPDAPIRLEADATRIEQVLTNLLGNASKSTDPGGSIALEVSPEPGQVVIRIRDDGIGIEPAMLTQIFDLFTQADQSLARAQGGLGIGLTLVRSLVELHGGSVEARSEGLGQGSEFVVRLPATGVDATPVRSEDIASGHPSEGTIRVLIVDDNVHAADSLAMVVKLWNHDARVVHDGPTAIVEAEAYRPQVVLLDIGLPGMDGYRVAADLRGRAGFEDLTLIAMTGYGRDEDFRRSESVGFARHLVKPIDFAELQSLLDEVAARS
jgi:signal transduction histidine kinase